MKTAMQELIERLQTLNSKHNNAGLLTAIEIASDLKGTERRIIEKVSIDMVTIYRVNPSADMEQEFMDYFNATVKP